MPRAYLAPLRFRFTHPDDIAIYGEDWYLYSEPMITSMPARDLAALETELDMPLVDVMNGVRESTSMGDLGAAWIGIKLDPDRGEKCPPFADFNVHTMLMDWERAPEGKAPSPPSMAAPTPTAALPSLPAVEQPG
jgi:hypothetical protein